MKQKEEEIFKKHIIKKIEIVKWCLDHDRNIVLTAAHFKGNYAQIYQWVKKYELNGENGLTDKRGKHKKEEDLTEIEILKRKLKQSEAEKEESVGPPSKRLRFLPKPWKR